MLTLFAQRRATLVFSLSATCFFISVVCLKNGSAKEWKKKHLVKETGLILFLKDIVTL